MIGGLARAAAALLLAGGSAAMGALAVDFLGPLPEGGRASGAPGGAGPGGGAAAPEAAAPEFEAYAALLSRPLFRPDRRAAEPEMAADEAPEEEPEEIAEAPEPEPEEPLDAILRGVVVSGAGGFALVEPAGDDPLRLAPGDEIDGWRLESLAPASATFERDGRTVTLTLRPKGE